MADYSSTVSSTVDPFRQVTELMKERLRKCIEYKDKHFQKDANEARFFLKGGEECAKFLYGEGSKSGDFKVNNVKTPDFLMNTNRVAEMKDLFRPHLYHQNPYRQVNPRTQPEMPQEIFFQPVPQIQQMAATNPEMAQQYEQFIQQQQQQQYQSYMQQISSGDAIDKAAAILMQAYLNWTPTPLNLKDHFGLAIDEALVTGLGIMSAEPYRPAGSQKVMFGNFYDSVDNHVLDPDGESIENAKIWFRRRILPVWEVENRRTAPYGYPHGYLKGNAASIGQESANGKAGIDPMKIVQGECNDLLVYWEVYSKMGLGARLAGASKDLRSSMDQFGDYVYMELCNTCPVPINFLAARNGSGEDLQRAMRWPTPYWRDDGWPFTPIMFHPQSRCVYPYSHVKPALPELKFLNWCYSFLASKVRTVSRDFIVTLRQAGEQLKKILLEGPDLSHLDLQASDGSFKINDVVQWLQHPSMQGDIFIVLDRIESQFERRTGMTPLLYGEAATQSRLAADADFRQQRSMVRIDDMADCVEVAASKAARNEALGAAYHLDPYRDIAGPLGPTAAQYWDQYIDFENMLQSQEFRIEAGSIRKPNRERDKENANQAVQVWGPLLQGVALNMGDVNPINELIEQWGKANDADVRRMKLTPPPPPTGPSPEEQKLMLEQQQMQMQMQMEEFKAMMEQQRQQQDMQLKEREAELDAVAREQEMAMDAVRGQQELAQDRQQSQQELAQSAATFAQEMAQLRAKYELELKILKDKQEQSKKAGEEKLRQQKKQANQKKATVKK